MNHSLSSTDDVRESNEAEFDDLDRAAQEFVFRRPFLPLLNKYLQEVSLKIFDTLKPAQDEVGRIMRFMYFAQASLLYGSTPVTLRANLPTRSLKPSFQARVYIPKKGTKAVYVGRHIPLLTAVLENEHS